MYIYISVKTITNMIISLNFNNLFHLNVTEVQEQDPLNQMLSRNKKTLFATNQHLQVYDISH
jgi:hypothetical protein